MILSRNPLCALQQLHRHLIALERQLRESHAQHNAAEHPLVKIACVHRIAETGEAIDQTLYDIAILSSLLHIPLSEQERVRVGILFRSRSLCKLPPLENSSAVRRVIQTMFC